jgi:energy-coupling factor transport system substrate-specific component
VRGWLASRLEDAALGLVTGLGIVLFLAPLAFGSRFPQTVVLFTAFVLACVLVVLAVALQTHRLSTRLLAILGALVAIDATLRLVVVVGLLGFSPIFFLIIVGGYVMGPTFGFASGALTLLLSAIFTAGLGPWLPYQMMASAWVGMGSGYLGRLTGRSPRRSGILLLCLYGAVAGIVYGLLLDLWEWPLLLPSASSTLSYAPEVGVTELARRFGAFYLSTSLLYDAFRAAGNVALLGLLGHAVVTGLDRFRRRFVVTWRVPPPLPHQTPVKISADVGPST